MNLSKKLSDSRMRVRNIWNILGSSFGFLESGLVDLMKVQAYDGAMAKLDAKVKGIVVKVTMDMVTKIEESMTQMRILKEEILEAL